MLTLGEEYLGWLGTGACPVQGSSQQFVPRVSKEEKEGEQLLQFRKRKRAGAGGEDKVLVLAGRIRASGDDMIGTLASASVAVVGHKASAFPNHNRRRWI